MKVIIAGSDIVAVRIAEALMINHEVTHVGAETSISAKFDELDLRVVRGSATSPSVLREAQVEDTDVFVASTGNDEQNIVACLAAQRLGARRTVCVLTRPGFFSTGDDDAALAESLGIDEVVRPSALDVQVFAGGRVRLLSYVVEAGAPLTRAPIKDLRMPKGVVMVMLRRGDEMIVPTGVTQIQSGDKVMAMGRWRPLRRLLFRFLRSESHGRDKRKATIVGAGTVGTIVARGLEEAGWQVKLIENNRSQCEEAASRLKSLVLYGDGADIDLLEQERVDDSAVLVAVTNNDEKNLLVSLLAKQLGVPRIVTRADRLSNERMFEKVGVDVVRSAHGAAIRTVIQSIEGTARDIQAELEHGDARVIELDLPEDFPVTRLRDLRPPTYAMVGTIMRDRQLIVPSGDDRLQPQDRVLVFCTSADEERTRYFFSHPRSWASEV
jgi:trk system potassium uptake protein TrkA